MIFSLRDVDRCLRENLTGKIIKNKKNCQPHFMLSLFMSQKNCRRSRRSEDLQTSCVVAALDYWTNLFAAVPSTLAPRAPPHLLPLNILIPWKAGGPLSFRRIFYFFSSLDSALFQGNSSTKSTKHPMDSTTSTQLNSWPYGPTPRKII